MVVGFGILTLVKSSLLKKKIKEAISVSCPSTLNFLFIGLSPSYDLSCRFDRLI